MNLFWFRRDLRLYDNTALLEALSSHESTLAIFIFDDTILNQLPPDDARVGFIYDQLKTMDSTLKEYGTGLQIFKGAPATILSQLFSEEKISSLYFNRDYEPYALERDRQIKELCSKNSIEVHTFKDHVIFEPGEVLKADGKPYTVYTPFKNKWLERLQQHSLKIQGFPKDIGASFSKINSVFPSKKELGLQESSIKVESYDLDVMNGYGEHRDFPDRNGTSRLGPHLRFGTVSTRELVLKSEKSPVFLSELIWREFFMQILYYFPKVVKQNFKSKYDGVAWRNNEEEFKTWCEGKTGYPMVDAGMRQLNTTGYMHNRVRMITAGFLCKHLLIDWRWGEAYFASKLLDFELASNNGNWQWAAGTGCDAAPYFRVFNPTTQFKKFDPNENYVKKWVPEYGTSSYPLPMVDHKHARTRALETYKIGLQ